MKGMATITAAQLRAAVNAWEVDVRADRDALVQDSEARALPLDEQVNGVVVTIFEYAAGFKADGSPLGGKHRGHCAPCFVSSAEVLKVFAPCSHHPKKAAESAHLYGSRAFPAERTPVCTSVRTGPFALSAETQCLRGFAAVHAAAIASEIGVRTGNLEVFAPWQKRKRAFRFESSPAERDVPTRWCGGLSRRDG